MLVAKNILGIGESRGISGIGNRIDSSGMIYLGGLFFAFNFLRNDYPASFVFEPNSISGFLDRKKERTNLISLTMLRICLQGHGLAPLHEFVNSTFTNQPNERIVASALELAKVGSSTGWGYYDRCFGRFDFYPFLFQGMPIIIFIRKNAEIRKEAHGH